MTVKNVGNAATVMVLPRNWRRRHLLIASAYCTRDNDVGKTWIATPYISPFSENDDLNIQ